MSNPESGFLSTLAPTPGANRLALVVVAVSAVVFLAAAPVAKWPLAAAPAFLPIYETALVLCELITAVLLFGQFHILKTRALLLLACAYLLSGVMAAAHMLSFPGLFASGGLLGGGGQTTAWLYFLWHGAFPLAVVGYAVARPASEAALRAVRPVRDMALGIAVVAAVAVGLVLVATLGNDALPSIMQGNRDAPAKFAVAFASMCLSVLALYFLWRRGGRSVVDLWLMVVMCVWICDVALASVFNAGRYDVGWYLGRIYGLAASSFLLMIMLLENGFLYARLARAHGELTLLNRDLETFSYSVSHDLGRPVRAVEGFARMLEEDYAGKIDDDGMQLIGVIRSEGRRMGDMIRDLLAFSRLGRQAMSMAEFDTQELVANILATLRQEPGGVRAEVACATLPRSRGDEALLRHVWTNLLANAIKYSGKREHPKIEIGSYIEEGADVFFVKDNGAGFDMKYYDKLFGVFQRMHSDEEFPGTGIGLAIVQRIVARHGGTVWAEGAVNEGAMFYFTLPRGKAEVSEFHLPPPRRRGVAGVMQAAAATAAALLRS